MLTKLDGLPPNVIGLEATGKVTADDYEKVFIPAADAVQREFDKIRLLYILGPKFEGYTVGAMFDDTKMMFKHWEKTAFVCDEDWLRHAMELFRWIFPGEVKIYAYADADQAREWVCAA